MNKFMKKLMTKKEGFTLVELIVVIAILAILAGVAIPAYSGYLKKANNTADITQLSAVKTAALAACATVGTVDEVEVAIANTGNTVDITCASKVFKLKYDSTTSKWVDAVPGTGTGAVVDGEEAVIADFNTYMSNANVTLKTGTGASWDGSDWTITE